ncbi:MAG: hypothetical protein AB7H71_13100 [Alphaproteobacteria bacterium]
MSGRINPARRVGPSEYQNVATSEGEPKDIVRRWNREIEAEIRREAARRDEAGPWKAIAWAALWLVWLVLLVLLLVFLKKLY